MRAWPILLVLLVPAVAAQSNNTANGTEGDTLAGEESVAGLPEFVFYVVVAALSLTVFIGLFVVSQRYARRKRGDRPPP